jgi:hypothetical protein
MNRQDQQAIDELFQRLYRQTEQGGPRDPEAEARIQEHFRKGPPGLLYHLAQTLVAQYYALEQAKSDLAAYRGQGGAPAGFARPQRAGRGGYGGGYGGGGYGGYQQPPQYQPGYQQAPGGSGFLAGAGRIALGVGGGILGAELLSSVFGGEGLFGDRGDTYVDQNVYVDQDDPGRGGDQDYAQDDGSQDDGGQDDYGDGDFGGGDFGGGDFGGDQGGW